MFRRTSGGLKVTSFDFSKLIPLALVAIGFGGDYFKIPDAQSAIYVGLLMLDPALFQGKQPQPPQP